MFQNVKIKLVKTAFEQIKNNDTKVTNGDNPPKQRFKLSPHIK